MWVILLEALAALLLLIGLVWWTMFSGRRGGERRLDDEADADAVTAASPTPDAPGSTHAAPGEDPNAPRR